MSSKTSTPKVKSFFFHFLESFLRFFPGVIFVGVGLYQKIHCHFSKNSSFLLGTTRQPIYHKHPHARHSLWYDPVFLWYVKVEGKAVSCTMCTRDLDKFYSIWQFYFRLEQIFNIIKFRKEKLPFVFLISLIKVFSTTFDNHDIKYRWTSLFADSVSAVSLIRD